jgi:8-amino-7-oxononanoate synthase
LAKGCSVRWFEHHSPESLDVALRGTRRAPVVVADGVCSACGAATPLPAYLKLVQEHGGRLLVDDTQALGVLGHRTGGEDRAVPYGRGGGGSLPFFGLYSRDIIVTCSLAKAFGAPLACIMGSSDFVQQLASVSQTRVHCSPPSLEAVHAGLQAFEMNRRTGDLLRRRLFERVAEFRRLLHRRGWTLGHGWFPVQTVEHPNAASIHRSLMNLGVRSLLQVVGRNPRLRLAFLLNAAHEPWQLGQLASALDALGRG